MTLDSTLKLQGWSRTNVKVAARKALLKAFLASIGNIESPRNPGVKMIDDQTIDHILKQSMNPATRRFFSIEERQPEKYVYGASHVTFSRCFPGYKGQR